MAQTTPVTYKLITRLALTLVHECTDILQTTRWYRRPLSHITRLALTLVHECTDILQTTDRHGRPSYKQHGRFTGHSRHMTRLLDVRPHQRPVHVILAVLILGNAGVEHLAARHVRRQGRQAGAPRAVAEAYQQCVGAVD